jgi:hypothetical protein
MTLDGAAISDFRSKRDKCFRVFRGFLAVCARKRSPSSTLPAIPYAFVARNLNFNSDPQVLAQVVMFQNPAAEGEYVRALRSAQELHQQKAELQRRNQGQKAQWRERVVEVQKEIQSVAQAPKSSVIAGGNQSENWAKYKTDKRPSLRHAAQYPVHYR